MSIWILCTSEESERRNAMLHEVSFESYNKRDVVYGWVYVPAAPPVGIIQLVHGFGEHSRRYLHMIVKFMDAGFIVAADDHVGHGKTALENDCWGDWGDKGVHTMMEDEHTLTQIVQDMYPGLPYFMYGHSMGSFISRLYVREYSSTVSGVIIHGTGGPNPLVGAGKLLAGIIKSFYGPYHRSNLINNMAFGSYNKKYPKEEGHNAWLTRDLDKVADRDTNEFTSFKFTVAGYTDLFTMLASCNSKAWFKSYPKRLPTMIMSGDMDPVCDYGKGPRYVYKQLLINGADNVAIRMYEGARHELFNEFNSDEVFFDILEWIRGVIA
jgi:alpha-beta hydrolase superfamily lysophospholipase